MSFYGREQELKDLIAIAEKPGAHLVVCHGRRRIGKSTLIKEFSSNYHFIEFSGLAPRKDLDLKTQLKHFSEQMETYFELGNITFENWIQAFTLLNTLLPKDRTVVLLLDEISWMAASDKDFAGKLKVVWDTLFSRHPNLVVALCGSISSWIEQNILNNTNFVGRISRSIHLKELPLKHCKQFWGKKANRISASDKVKVLSITGGVPKYLDEVDYSCSAEENIKNLCFSPSGFLFLEFKKVFRDIFNRRSSTYEKLVQTIIGGPKSKQDICDSCKKEPNGVISEYLEDLEHSGFIERDYTYSITSGKRSKLSKYRIRDNYLRFYLKYIEPNYDRIEKGIFELSSAEELPAYESIMGLQFETLVINNLPSVISSLNIPKSKIISASPFFQNATSKTKACQIDLLIQLKHTLYLCEIKFRKKVNLDVVDEVKEKIKRINPSKNLSIRPILITVEPVSKALKDEHFFDKFITFDDLLGFS